MVILVASLVAAFAPGGGAPGASALAPATKADAGSGSGTGPTSDPPANIAPSPNFLSDCAGTAYDNSSGCENATLAAIDNARNQEGLPGMVLPTDWAQLTPAQQLFVSTNLERTVRGAATPVGDGHRARPGLAVRRRPKLRSRRAPAGFPWTSWGGNWAGAVGSPLEAIYFWMYDDGPGSYNLDCTPSDSAGCWGHRNNILMSLHCQPCLMGTGFSATAYQGNPSWTELLVDSSGSPALDFSWSSVFPDLPGTAGGAVLDAPAVGISSTPDGQGYWLVASDGGVFAFGDAGFYGSMGGRSLAAPIVGISSTPDGRGYWLVASDGGLFAFGDAGFYGSMAGHVLARKVVGLASTPDGHGYWEVGGGRRALRLRRRRLLRVDGWPPPQPAGGGPGAHVQRQGLLGGGLGRRDLRLRRRPLLRVDGRDRPGAAGGGHGVDARR